MLTENAGKVIVINGAYGSIGSAIAHKLSAKGYSLAIMGRDEAKLESLQNSLSSNIQCHNKIKKYLLDMRDYNSILDSEKNIISDFGKVEILINAAGPIPLVGNILEISDDQWFEAIQTTLIGTVRLVKTFGERMTEQSTGKILLINGVLSIQPDPLFIVSSTLTAAINNFAKAISKDFGKRGVTINTINPGVTKTSLLDEVVNQVAKKFNIASEDVSKKMIEDNPLGRIAAPTDVANLVEFLCSNESNFLNGSFVTVDGGSSMAY